MNKKRREQIRTIVARLQGCVNEIELTKDEEDESRENMPENLQYSDSYLHSEECSDILMDAVECISGTINDLEGIT